MFGTSLSRICVGVVRLFSGLASCGARCLMYSVIAMISSSLTTPRKVGMMDWNPETTLAFGAAICLERFFTQRRQRAFSFAARQPCGVIFRRHHHNLADHA